MKARGHGRRSREICRGKFRPNSQRESRKNGERAVMRVKYREYGRGIHVLPVKTLQAQLSSEVFNPDMVHLQLARR